MLCFSKQWHAQLQSSKVKCKRCLQDTQRKTFAKKLDYAHNQLVSLGGLLKHLKKTKEREIERAKDKESKR